MPRRNGKRVSLLPQRVLSAGYLLVDEIIRKSSVTPGDPKKTMENISSFTEPQVIGAIFSSSENPEVPGRREPKEDRYPRGKKLGNRVLVVGRLHELALYRAEFLRQAGFMVSTAGDVEDAIRMMQRSAFDAVVLSYTLPNDTAQYLAKMARDFCNDCPIVAIAEAPIVDGRIAPDVVALADEGPSGLVSALQQVLRLP
jgi:CheY-like chemotaxis protein